MSIKFALVKRNVHAHACLVAERRIEAVPSNLIIEAAGVVDGGRWLRLCNCILILNKSFDLQPLPLVYISLTLIEVWIYI
jgi:hypothetical protein